MRNVWRTRLLAALTALAVLAGTSGCTMLGITEDEFVGVASGFALAPDKTCEELKYAFGVPHLPTVDTPEGIGIAYEEAAVTTAEGNTLRVWYVPALLDRGTVVLSMGAVGNMSCFLYVTYMLRANGWSVVMYDYTGFGGSSGSPSLVHLYDDLDAVLTWTLERTGQPQATLMGVSIGSIPSVALAVSRPEAVNGVVIDGPISIAAEIKRFRALLLGNPPDFLARLDPLSLLDNTVPQLTQPALVFLYGRDEYMSSAAFPPLTSAAPAPIRLVRFDDLAHARGPYLETAVYFAELDAYLASVWSPPLPQLPAP
jgi:pimeloyl-ACP methyl ester carboxylesterase